MYIDLGMLCETFDVRMNVCFFFIFLNSLYVVISSEGQKFEDTETQNSDESSDSCLSLAQLSVTSFSPTRLQLIARRDCVRIVSPMLCTLGAQKSLYLLNERLLKNVSRLHEVYPGIFLECIKSFSIFCTILLMRLLK